jgi:hypothetical protein
LARAAQLAGDTAGTICPAMPTWPDRDEPPRLMGGGADGVGRSWT